MSTRRGHLRREGRTWRLILRHARDQDGLRRRSSVKLGSVAELPTKTAAREAADRWIARAHPSEVHPGTVVPWSTWCDRYADRILAMQATGTRRTATSIIACHLREAFPCAVHEISPARVADFIAAQHKTGAAAATIGARFKVLRRMLRQAVVEGLAATPPTAPGTRLPKDEQVPETVHARAFTASEVRAILEAAVDPYGTAYALAAFAGLRAGEVLGLTWSAIDLETGALTIRQQAVDRRVAPLKTSGSHATLRAPAPLLVRLRAYRETWTPNERQLLFANEAGEPWSGAELRAELHRLLARLGLRRRGVHAFRHACALAMAESGCSPEALRRAMRHSSLRVTAVYLSASPEDIAAALERAANILAVTA